MTPCQNGGTCLPTAVCPFYICRCISSSYGERCESFFPIPGLFAPINSSVMADGKEFAAPVEDGWIVSIEMIKYDIGCIHLKVFYCNPIEFSININRYCCAGRTGRWTLRINCGMTISMDLVNLLVNSGSVCENDSCLPCLNCQWYWLISSLAKSDVLLYVNNFSNI